AIRRFLCEVCPAGAVDLGKINHAVVVRYVERHARDGSPSSGKVMCWSLRAFFRYLHHKGLGMPIPPDVGAAVVAYLRDARPKSSCRCLFLRAPAPHVGFPFPSLTFHVSQFG